jgi:hypothetical protein
MSVADKASYLSRFTMKFVEIVAAGAATAVSGYLVAHFGAKWSAPTPPATPAIVQAAPSTAQMPTAASGSPSVTPIPSPSTPAAGALRPAAQQAAVPTAKPTVRATANAAPAAPGRKHPATDTATTENKAPREAAETKPPNAPETKPHETAEAKHDSAETKHDAAEAKPHETAETKAPDWESVEARIRAALAKADANRPTPPEKPAQAATAVPAPAAVVGAAPKPEDTPAAPVGSAALNVAPASTDAALPRAAEVPQAAQQAPVLSDPPAAVEIKSRPIATIDASASPETAAPPTEPQQNAQDSAQTDPRTQVKSFFAAIKHIPDMLRTAAPAANPPRPPAPVGD